MALFVARMGNTSLAEIERWQPEKLIGYFEAAMELHSQLNGGR